MFGYRIGDDKRTYSEGFIQKLEDRRARDIVVRHRVAVRIYPAVISLIFACVVVFDNSSETIALLATFWILIVLSALFRAYVLNRFECSLNNTVDYDYKYLDIAVFLGAFSWGLFVGLSLLDNALSPHFELIYTGAIGVVAGGAISLSLREQFIRIFLPTITLPSIIVSISGWSSHHPGFAILLMSFAWGMYSISKTIRGEYESGIYQENIPFAWLSNLAINDPDGPSR